MVAVCICSRPAVRPDWPSGVALNDAAYTSLILDSGCATWISSGLGLPGSM